jgi:hypothetical protein
MEPDEELLGVVVHSGLILVRGSGAVAALRRITAFPDGLSLDATVVALDIHAEAAGRREREATVHRQEEAAARQELEATARQEHWELIETEGQAAAERAHLRRQAMIDRRSLPRFDDGDTLRLAVLTRGGDTDLGDTIWLDPYQSTSSSKQDRYHLEASFWTFPLPAAGLLTLACAWPEIGLPETMTDVVLPDLAARAAEALPLWASAADP